MENDILKRDYSSLEVGLHEQFATIDRLKESFPVSMLCDAIEVYCHSYKYWKSHTYTEKPEGVRIKPPVGTTHKLSNGSAGARSLAGRVTDMDTPLNRYTKLTTSDSH